MTDEVLICEKHNVHGAAGSVCSSCVLGRASRGKPDWFEHTGGNMPVPPEMRVQVRTRDGEIGEANASDIRWHHLGTNCDIVAYCIAAQPAANGSVIPHRAVLLREAEQIICHDRQDTHGRPEDTFHLISEYWTCYLAHPISAADVAVMMSLFKIARLQKNPSHEDNVTDGIGYLAIAGELIERSKL